MLYTGVCHYMRSDMSKPEDYKRIYWHSRRGMLELDLILLPFVEQRLADLSDAEQDLYRQLLKSEDQDLFKWLLRSAQPDTLELQTIVNLILEFIHKQSNV